MYESLFEKRDDWVDKRFKLLQNKIWKYHFDESINGAFLVYEHEDLDDDIYIFHPYHDINRQDIKNWEIEVTKGHPLNKSKRFWFKSFEDSLKNIPKLMKKYE